MFIQIFIYMDKHKICSICGINKNIIEFYKSQRGRKCKSCILEITRNYKREKRKDFVYKKQESDKQKERRLRLWESTLLHTSKRKGVENTLTIEDIKNLYITQNGLCFWFKIPLIPSEKNKHPQQPSLDRLDINKGYTKDNVVLTCYSANIGRNETDMETWVNFLDVLFKK